ncbi:MAG: adenylosuccinate lyase [Planctomycetes bacterium]|nr:adenylosuccinate lyase [Planctomycetota bacterium]
MTDDDLPPSTLADRYAGRAMARLFTPRARALAFRDVWIALAEAEHELGGPVTRAQVEALRATREQVDLARVARLEAETRHDVMAHVKAWAEVCPEGAPIIHLGATSQCVNDNADALLERRALQQVRARLVSLLRGLRRLAAAEAATTTLGYTHFQTAQPVTVGKRAALWAQDAAWDLEEVERLLAGYACRGLKGTTGTQASYLELLGDPDRVVALDRLFARKLGFERTVPLTGQTAPRKLDARLADALVGVAVSLSKLGTDARLLAHTGELREAFGAGQVGSSAMPYKRNPMKAERLCALARLVPSLRDVLVHTAMTQWLERSLDDSAARRVALPDLFLATDGALRTAIDLVRGLEVDREQVARRLRAEAPFLAVEELLAAGVKAGGDRQDLHEALRGFAVEARVTADPPGEFWRRVTADPRFAALEPVRSGRVLETDRLVGLAPRQVHDFLVGVLDPLLARATDVPEADDPLRV